jgi:acetolactate synthase-1/2/3 large subunit
MTIMSGAQCLAEMLEGYGATHLFMVPAVLRRTMAELERRTHIKSVHTHGEKSAAYMADGYARVSRRPGICMAQEVGVLNLAAGLRDASLAHSPVIALTGGRWSKHRYRRMYQDAEDLSALAPYTKMNVAVDDVARIPDLLRQAYRVATTGCPGPVHLQFAGQEGELDREEGDLDTLCEPQFRQVPAFRSPPAQDVIANAWHACTSARRPVIVAGGGVHASDAGAALRDFVERAQIPVVTTLNGRDTVPDSHPLCMGTVGTYSRPSANQIVSQADLVIFVGTEAGSMTTNFWRLPMPGVRVIQIDNNPEAIGRNYPPILGILADARPALELLTSAIQGAKSLHQREWLDYASRIKHESLEETRIARESDAMPIRPERICGELSALLPEDSVVVVDTGHAGMWMAGYFDLTSPHQSYLRSAGHLGWAFPAGIGAKAACPDRPVVTFTGDLGMWYHIAEIETAVRANIPVVTIVNNNRSGNQSKRGFDLAYGGQATEKSRDLWVHTEVNFARIAHEMGAFGIRAETPAEVRPAIEKALLSGQPAVVDVVTDINAFAPLAWDAEAWAQKY